MALSTDSPVRASHFLYRQKVTQKTTPVSLRKPAKNQKFEAPPKLGKRYRRLPQTVGVLKPQTSNFYRLGSKGKEERLLGELVNLICTKKWINSSVFSLLNPAS